MKIPVLTVEGLLDRMDDNSKRLQQDRIKGLEQIALINKVQSSSLGREKKRLTEKYSAEHPRVKQIEARIKYNQNFAGVIQNEIIQSSVTLPEFTACSWQISGRIIKQGNVPLEGLTVSLINEKGKHLKDLGFACTDEHGWFLIHVEDEEGRLVDAYRDQDLFIAVTDNQKRMIYRHQDPFQFILKDRNYVEFTIDAKGCAEPPEKVLPVTADSPEVWILEGKVKVKDKQKDLSGFIVELFEKKEQPSVPIKSSTTDKEGKFQFIFSPREWPELFKIKPNLLLRILDLSGSTLFKSRKTYVPQVSKKDHLNINLK